MSADSIVVKEVPCSKSQSAHDFIEVPFSIYKNNDYWVPWFSGEMKQFIDRNHPVFEHTEGELMEAFVSVNAGVRTENLEEALSSISGKYIGRTINGIDVGSCFEQFSRG